MSFTFCPVIEIEDLGSDAFGAALAVFIDKWCEEVGASSEELSDALDDRAATLRREQRRLEAG